MKNIMTGTAFLLLAATFCSCGGGDEPQQTKAPAAPSNLVLHSSSRTSLTFQWDPVDGAQSYLWTLDKGAGTTKVDGGTVRTRNVVVSGLESGTQYRFGVASVGQDTGTGALQSSEVYLTASTEAEEAPTPDPDPQPSAFDYDKFLIPSAEEDGRARAFPGAEGGGMYTTGGRGGAVYHVTNLNDSGNGSLRWALGQKGARTIVFDVAGTIELSSQLKITSGDVTIAGQTAPGDGICIKNLATEIQADNVIVRFVRFRVGDDGKNAGDSEDCIWGRYHSNIILDHCSMSWSIDECASFYANEYMTMQWCLLSESMRNSNHSKGAHGYGGIWGGKDASFHHNLLANHYSRNPRPDHPEIYPKASDGTFDLSKRGNVDFRNLVIYNWGDNSTYGGEGGHFNLVSNYYKPGPDSRDRYYFFDAYSVYSSSKVDYGYPSLYLSGNIHTAHDDMSSDNTAHGVYFHVAESYSPPSGYSFAISPHGIGGQGGQNAYVTTHTASKAYDKVLEYSGASLVRDEVDKRAVNGARNNTGKIIDTPSDVGGYPSYSASTEHVSKVKDTDGDGIPDYYEDFFGLDKNNPADGKAVSLDKNGRYTNLEMYLHYLVKDIVAAQVQDGQYGKL